MVQLLTPQLGMLAEVPNDEVTAYCQTNGLVAKRGSTGDIIAYPATTEGLLQHLQATGIVIRRINPERPLRDEVRSHLASGRVVVVTPTPKEMRHFFSQKGFLLAMAKLLEEVTEAEIVVAAGVYGDRCIMAVQPRFTEANAGDST